MFRSSKGYGYYGYQELDKFPSNRKDRKQAKLLLRLASRSDVGSAFIPTTAEKSIFAKALRLAQSKMSLTSEPSLADNARLILSRGSQLELEHLLRLLERPGRIIALKDVPYGWKDSLFEALDEGLMFFGKNTLIIFNRPGMQKVAYSLDV